MKPIVLAGPLATLVVVFLSTAAPGASQSLQQPKWWHSEPTRRELGLTQEQSRRLEEIFQAAIPSQRTLKKALDDEEAQFGRLMNDLATDVDKRAAIEQMNRVEAARAALKKSHSQMLIEMRQVLTRDQWIRLGALQQAAEKERTATAEKTPDKGK
jgi:Spy/CpxP family protein refolding chaperone